MDASGWRHKWAEDTYHTDEQWEQNPNPLSNHRVEGCTSEISWAKALRVIFNGYQPGSCWGFWSFCVQGPVEELLLYKNARPGSFNGRHFWATYFSTNQNAFHGPRCRPYMYRRTPAIRFTHFMSGPYKSWYPKQVLKTPDEFPFPVTYLKSSGRFGNCGPAQKGESRKGLVSRWPLFHITTYPIIQCFQQSIFRKLSTG